MVAGGLLVYYGYGRAKLVISANTVGKICTAMFALAVVLTFFREYTAPVNDYCMWAAIALSLYALAQYSVIAAKQVAQIKKGRHEREDLANIG